ncbi:ABC transporter permease [Clostridium sp. LP20]|uniref:ABC transporter permease n=1 Tax=Clostridium sp. LP20 TaxID=3418665 RepID=UPI003EE4CA9D
MQLNKRLKRNIKKNLSFYFVSSLLTILTCILIIASMSTGTTMTTVFNDFFDKNNVEDAQIYTALPIPRNEINELEETYNVKMEEVRYHDEEYDDYTLRLFSNNESINIYEVTKGNDIRNNNEILISQRFAEANNLDINDNIKVGKDTYNIVGFMVKPDYMHMLKSLSDAYFDYNSFGIGVMSNDELDKFNDYVGYYSTLYEDDNIYDFRNAINDKYKVRSYVAASSNNRIKTAADQGEKVSEMAFNFAPVLFIIVMAVIALVLSRKIKDEQKEIGTLSALGYRKKDLLKHYLTYSSVPAVLGSVFGIIFGLALTKPFSNFYFGDYETLPHTININVPSLLVCIVAPIILFSFVTIIVVISLLRHNTIDLLSRVVGKKNKKVKRLLVNSKLNFKTKFKIRSIIGNPFRSIVVAFGIVCASICMILGFGLLDALDTAMEQVNKEIKYENSYSLNTFINKIPSNADGVISNSCEVKGNSKLFEVWGIDKENDFIDLETISGAKIEYGEYYLTAVGAEAYGVNAGDELEFYDVLTTKKYSIKIKDIIDEKTKAILYTSKENAAELFGCKPDESNFVISDENLDFENNSVMIKYSKTQMLKAAEELVDIFKAMCYVIIAIGVLLSINIIYLISNMLINENLSNINMLGVLGYKGKEINNMILTTNHVLVVLGFIIACPLTLSICKVAFADSITTMGVYIPAVLSIKSIILSFGITLVSYFITLFSLRKKVDNQNIVESLSDNRE